MGLLGYRLRISVALQNITSYKSSVTGDLVDSQKIPIACHNSIKKISGATPEQP